jgi:hypothetical protein
VLLMLPPIEGLPIPSYLAIAAWLLGGIALVPVIVAQAGRIATRAEPWFARRVPSGWPRSDCRRATAGATGALAGVVVSFALASAMAVMVGSFRQSVDDWLGAVLPADVYARAGTAGGLGALDPARAARLRDLPGVQRMELLRVRERDLGARASGRGAARAGHRSGATGREAAAHRRVAAGAVAGHADLGKRGDGRPVWLESGPGACDCRWDRSRQRSTRSSPASGETTRASSARS